MCRNILSVLQLLYRRRSEALIIAHDPSMHVSETVMEIINSSGTETVQTEAARSKWMLLAAHVVKLAIANRRAFGP